MSAQIPNVNPNASVFGLWMPATFPTLPPHTTNLPPNHPNVIPMGGDWWKLGWTLVDIWVDIGVP